MSSESDCVKGFAKKIKDLGQGITLHMNEYDEFEVRVASYPDATYYTDELEDALLTAQAMYERKWRALPHAPHGVKWTAVLGYTRCSCESPPCSVKL